ncbi:hypothetical protein FF098_014295 [Parvularcula flava]|uniref:Uncharacterized protein n=2 Tax=Aquisalinus luteolus TaxID=1566827 RepID=A0ABX0HM01_9PROT|nr:hypothetical protein [Aquisalinus luteolus]NHK29090.1 hypothetical protein [Aquisalinus luteolus]
MRKATTMTALLLGCAALTSPAHALESCSREEYSDDLDVSVSYYGDSAEALSLQRVAPSAVEAGDTITGADDIAALMVSIDIDPDSDMEERREYMSAGIRFAREIPAFTGQDIEVGFIFDGVPWEKRYAAQMSAADAVYAWDTVIIKDRDPVGLVHAADKIAMSFHLPDGSVVTSGDLSGMMTGHSISMLWLDDLIEQAENGECEAGPAAPPPPPPPL